jgi:hypothetical protein
MAIYVNLLIDKEDIGYLTSTEKRRTTQSIQNPSPMITQPIQNPSPMIIQPIQNPSPVKIRLIRSNLIINYKLIFL